MKIRTLDVEQAKSLDRLALERFGIPSLLLMENAGIGLAKHIRAAIIAPMNRCRIVMLCGTGNNGGDAFAAARHLFQSSYTPELFVLGEESSMKEDAAINYRIIRQLGLSCEPASEFEKRQKDWSRAPVLIVDAVLGTGFTSPLRQPAKDFIAQINRFKKFHDCTVRILAVDVPSGLDGNEGPIGSDIVQADMTVTFACVKKGMTKPEARTYVGRTEVVDIGIPEALFQNEGVR